MVHVIPPLQKTATTVLLGFEAQPPMLGKGIFERILAILTAFGAYKVSMTQLYKKSSQDLQKQSTGLAGDICKNIYWQAGAQLLTGFASIGAGAAAATLGTDATSLVNITTKFGDAGGTFLRAGESWSQSEKGRIEHKLQGIGDAIRRVVEIFQQALRTLQSFFENRTQQIGHR